MSRRKDGMPYKVVRCHFYDSDGRAIHPYCVEGNACRFVHPYDKEWPGLPPRSEFLSTKAVTQKRAISPSAYRRSFLPSERPDTHTIRQRSLSPIPKRARLDEYSYTGKNHNNHPNYFTSHESSPVPGLESHVVAEPDCGYVDRMIVDATNSASITADARCPPQSDAPTAPNILQSLPTEAGDVIKASGTPHLIGELAKVHLRLLEDKKYLEDESIKLEAFESLATKFEASQNISAYTMVSEYTTSANQASLTEGTSRKRVKERISNTSPHEGTAGQSLAHMALLGTLHSIQERRNKAEQRIKADYEEMTSIIHDIWMGTLVHTSDVLQATHTRPYSGVLGSESQSFSASLMPGANIPNKRLAVIPPELSGDPGPSSLKTIRAVSFQDEVGRNQDDRNAIRVMEEKLVGVEKKLSKIAAIEKENGKLKAELKSQKDQVGLLKRTVDSQERRLARIMTLTQGTKQPDHNAPSAEVSVDSIPIQDQNFSDELGQARE